MSEKKLQENIERTESWFCPIYFGLGSTNGLMSISDTILQIYSSNLVKLKTLKETSD
jgi:hypothetical protein